MSVTVAGGTRTAPAAGAIARANWRPLAITGAYALFALVLTFPIALDLAGAVADFGDPLVMVWYLAWYAHSIPGNIGGILDPPIFFPHRDVLLFHDHLIAQGIAAWPIVRATGNPVLALNLLVVVSFTLAALGGNLLTLRFTGSRPAAFLVGLAVAFSAFRIAHVSHLNLLWLHWLPFVLLVLERFLVRGGIATMLALGLLVNLLVLSSYNFAPLVAVALAVWIVVRLASEPSLLRRLPSLALGLGVVAATTAAINLPLALRYLAVSERLGFSRSADEVRAYSASLTDYLVVPPSNGLLGQIVAPIRAADWSERALFPGIVVVAFAPVGVWVAIRSHGRPRSIGLALTALAVVMLILSFGLNPAQLPGLRWYPWLFEHLPGLAGLRAPARAGGVVQIALALLAGFGLAKVLRSGDGTVRAAIATGLAGLLFVESVAFPSSYAVPVWLGEGAVAQPTDTYPALGRNPASLAPASTAAVDWLRTAPGSGAIAEIPMLLHTERAWLESVRMLAGTRHWRPLVNGTSAYRPADLVELSRRLAAFPTAGTVEQLRALGVEYVIVHRGSLSEVERGALDSALPTSPLTEVARFDNDVVYQIGEPPG
ncbi:MAG: hypothetical protein U0556_12530 [Dehalococcoidia bacterium]